MAQINFVPPDMKTYKITQVRGNSRVEKIVRELLDRETESAKKRRGSEISRTNYDFVFLRQENFGVAAEYVLGIVPKRKDKYLLRGQMRALSISAELKESRSPREKSVLLDQGYSYHSAIRGSQRYVGARFL
jgi:hypothetical protein